MPEPKRATVLRHAVIVRTPLYVKHVPWSRAYLLICVPQTDGKASTSGSAVAFVGLAPAELTPEAWCDAPECPTLREGEPEDHKHPFVEWRDAGRTGQLPDLCSLDLNDLEESLRRLFTGPHGLPDEKR